MADLWTGPKGQKGQIPTGHRPERETDGGGVGPPLVAGTGQGETQMKEEGGGQGHQNSRTNSGMEETSTEIQNGKECQDHLHRREGADYLKDMKETGQGHLKGGKDRHIEDLYLMIETKVTITTQGEGDLILETCIEDQSRGKEEGDLILETDIGDQCQGKGEGDQILDTGTEDWCRGERRRRSDSLIIQVYEPNIE
jgi:hypothetical protein